MGGQTSAHTAPLVEALVAVGVAALLVLVARVANLLLLLSLDLLLLLLLLLDLLLDLLLNLLDLGLLLGLLDGLLLGLLLSLLLQVVLVVGLVVGRVKTGLDEVLALGLGDQRLQLRRGERVHEPGLGHDKEKHLGAGQDRQLVRLLHDPRLTLRERDVAPGLVLDELDFDLTSLALASGLVVQVELVHVCSTHVRIGKERYLKG